MKVLLSFLLGLLSLFSVGLYIQASAAVNIVLEITPLQPKPNTPFTMKASGCTPGENVNFRVTFSGTDVEAKADGTATLDVPAGLPEGSYTLTVTCSEVIKTQGFAVADTSGTTTGPVRLSLQSPTDHTPLAGEDVTIKSEGCDAGSVAQFIWDYSGSFTSPNREGKVSTQADKTALYTHSYEAGTVHLAVTCKVNGVEKTSETFRFPIAAGSTVVGSPTPYPTQPDPPPPICANFDSKGKCTEVRTAIGPICTEAKCFAEALFVLILSMSGGIAMLIILYAGYIYVTSRGKPEQLQKAREWLISALIGFLFIIFSLVIMQSITGDLLRLPGFPSTV